MNSGTWTKTGLLKPENIFRFFKYSIYALLCYNTFLFFSEDLAASAEVFGENISWRNVVEAYTATFDTSAWIILLLLFELETAVLPDHLLKGGLNWFLKSLAAIAYLIIIYSFYGYCVKYGLVSNVVAFNIADVCSLIGTDFTWVESLDEYLPLDQASCTALNSQPMLQIVDTNIIGSSAALAAAYWLTVIDVINSSTWLIIVALLEIEVYLQLKDKLTSGKIVALKYSKGFFYLMLLVCATYWGFEGSFLDFWDAFLWLLAFIFIELNIFQWHSETEE